MKPLLSILIPIYGVEKYIERCATAIFNSTKNDVEVIFINDSSPDKSMEKLYAVIARYPQLKDSIKVINHKYNMGLAVARLTGLKAAKGKYIWFVDSDDYISKNAIDIILVRLKDNPDMLSFNFYEHNVNQNIPKYRKSMSINSLLMFYTSPMIWDNVFLKELFFINKIFPIKGMNYSEDYILFSKLITKIRRVIFLPDFLYYYNTQNVQSYLHTVSTKNLIEAANGILDIVDFYEKEELSKQYKIGLLYSLYDRYCSLKKKDYSGNVTILILEKIKELSPFFYKLFLFLEQKRLNKLSLIILKICRIIVVTLDFKKLF